MSSRIRYATHDVESIATRGCRGWLDAHRNPSHLPLLARGFVTLHEGEVCVPGRREEKGFAR